MMIYIATGSFLVMNKLPHYTQWIVTEQEIKLVINQ